jgi:hypothetical protein
MDYQRTKEVWNEFGRDITDAARRQLGTRKIGKNRRYGDATGTLRRSLTYTMGTDTVSLSFMASPPADTYANFINYGVNGTEVNRGAPYSMGSKQPPRDAILAWMKAKPVRLRDPKSGSFLQQTPARMNSAAFLIARSIKKKGIHGLFYFQKGYEAVQPDYDTKIMDALAFDIAESMVTQLGGTDLTQES